MWTSSREYSSASRRIGWPRQRTSPRVGASNPHRMRSRLVLPLPLAPVMRKASPVFKTKLNESKSLRPPRTHSRSAASSIDLVQVERVALERQERHVVEHVLVRRLEDDARRAARFPGLDPAQHVQAPALAVLEAAEAQVGARGDEVVAARDAEVEELARHLHAHEVGDAFLAMGGAAAVA